MPTDDHDELHEWAGAYALGALDPDDRRRFERHLTQCERCAAEIRAVAPIPGLLGRIDVDDLDVGTRPETADAISRRVRHEAHRLRRSRNRWRLAAGGAAATAIVTLGAVIALTADDADIGDDDGAVAAAVTSSLAASTDVTTTARGWGTQIDLDLSGLPPRARYQLWAVDESGTWSVAASWGPTATGRARVTGATATPLDALGRLLVTSDDRNDVIVEAST